jgi:hypothetical protein
LLPRTTNSTQQTLLYSSLTSAIHSFLKTGIKKLHHALRMLMNNHASNLDAHGLPCKSSFQSRKFHQWISQLAYQLLSL